MMMGYTRVETENVREKWSCCEGGVVASTVRAGENVRLQKGRLMRMNERGKFKQGQPRGKYVLIKIKDQSVL